MSDKPIPDPTIARFLPITSSPITKLALSKDRTVLAGATLHGTILFWDPHTGEIQPEAVSVSKYSIKTLAFDANGWLWVLPVPQTEPLCSLRSDDGKAWFRHPVPEFVVTHFAVSPKGSVVYICGDDRNVYQRESEHVIVYKNVLEKNDIADITFNQDGTRFALCDVNQHCFEMEVRPSGRIDFNVKRYLHADVGVPHSLFWKGDKLCCAGPDHVQEHGKRRLFPCRISCILAADDHTLLVGSDDQPFRLMIFDTQNSTPPKIIYGFKESIKDMCFLDEEKRYLVLSTGEGPHVPIGGNSPPCILDFGAPNLGRGKAPYVSKHFGKIRL